MSEFHSLLQVSPKKKRCPPELDDGNTFTPKKLRTAPPTPPPSTSREFSTLNQKSLPPHLARLYNVQTALQHALSHALATCAISPTPDQGIVRNVLNNISLTTYSGFATSFDTDDLKRLCWLWEWDGKPLDTKKSKITSTEEEDNPFLTPSISSAPPTDWTRGAMGVILSPATHFSKLDRKRVPAYGIGIEVEMDIDKNMGGGMAAVARWTAGADKRRSDLFAKLQLWASLHSDISSTPNIPLADLPDLAPKVSALTRTLAAQSPSAMSPTKLPAGVPSPSRSPTKNAARDFALPFPTLFPSISPAKKSSILFPQTPSRRQRHEVLDPGPPQTPSSKSSSPKNISPSTPIHQREASNMSVQTPSTSRRQALYERIRERSLSASPTKTPRNEITGAKMTRDQMLKMSQDELRRRCLLGRLSGVAESIWMLFSKPPTCGSSTPTRKRRALPTSDVTAAIIKSSPVPISAAEANESLAMLIKLCPFFLKQLNFSGEEWLEMPAPATNSNNPPLEDSPTKAEQKLPLSPGRLRGKTDSAQELVNRSPRRVKREIGGLREVREIIRRELELQD